MSCNESATGRQYDRLFELRTSGESLIMTFPRQSEVISWAPLHGGMRTHAAHILIHSVEPNFNHLHREKVLRRAASKAGIQGTIVGMFTTGSIHNYSVAESSYNDLYTSVVCMAGQTNLAAVGESVPFVERISSDMKSGSINLIIFVNYRLSHEAMLEAMAVATEAKVSVLYEFDFRSKQTRARATGGPTDCVAVVSGAERRYSYAGKATKWGELIGKACIESLRAAFSKVNQTN